MNRRFRCRQVELHFWQRTSSIASRSAFSGRAWLSQVISMRGRAPRRSLLGAQGGNIDEQKPIGHRGRRLERFRSFHSLRQHVLIFHNAQAYHRQHTEWLRAQGLGGCERCEGCEGCERCERCERCEGARAGTRTRNPCRTKDPAPWTLHCPDVLRCRHHGPGASLSR
jgi:hypothetical protein